MRNFLMSVALLVFATTAWAHEFVETDYVEMPDLEPEYTTQSRLGEEIAIAGNQVLASARSASGGQGAVFAFDLTADGQLQFRERLPAQGSTSQFGRQLAADGGFAVASASGSPTLRFFARSGGTWQQTQQLELADVPAPANVFITSIGGELAMSGDLLAIGNHEAHVNPGADQMTTAGAVVLYRRGGNGQWQFETVVISPTPASNAHFGSAVAVAGNTLLVGAPGENKAYVFERIGGQWQLARNLQSPDSSFGWSVAVSGDLAVVGRGNAELPGISNAGSFRAYERNLGGTGQ